jgi:hypothetical protein
MIVSRSTRNMGFIRLAHLRHLERAAREYNELKGLLNSISEISFSKESIPLKIVSFLGFGSGIPNLLNLNPYKETLENLKLATDVAKNASGTSDPNQINDIVQRILEFGQFTFSVEEIFQFVLFGAIGIFLGSIGFRVFSYIYLHFEEKKLRRKQGDYWRDHYLEDMSNTLYSFFTDIKFLLKRYYNYTGDPVDPICDPVMTYQTEDEIKDFIQKNVLPALTIDWDIWLSPPQQSSPVQSTDKSENEGNE